ncbi:MAG: hypothetical protein AAB691_03570 [Patescibacteria group bacterium]
MEKWETRRQVPETDPVYQEERERSQKAYRENIFAEGAVHHYEQSGESAERARVQNQELRKRLALADPTGSEARGLSEAISENQKFIERMYRDRGRYLRSDFLRFTQDLAMFFRQSEGGRHEYVTSEAQYMLNDPGLYPEFQECFGDNLEEVTAENLFLSIANNELSDEFLLKIAKRHIEHVQKEEEVLEKIADETKREFKAAIKKQVEKGFLPESVLNSLQRIDSVAIKLSDRFKSLLGNFMGEHGDSGEIRISNEQLTIELIPQLKEVIFHELIHELSGRSITIRTKTEEDGFKWHQFSHRKSGVALRDPQFGYTPYTWLNEAITEWLALKFSGYEGDASEYAYKGSSAYTAERKELDRLMVSGLESDAVVAAYFENFSSDQPKNSQGKAYAALLQRINQLEGTFGFARLENRFILKDIGDRLYSEGVFSTHSGPPSEEISEHSKVFRIAISVGVNNEAEVKESFVYYVRPILVGKTTISIEHQWRRVKDTLDYISSKYGRKVEIVVGEE